MYIYRTYKIKMRILKAKRVCVGLQPKYIQKLDLDWCMKNQDFLTEGQTISELNAANGSELTKEDIEKMDSVFKKVGRPYDSIDILNSKIIMTKTQAEQYKLNMDEDWPFEIFND